MGELSPLTTELAGRVVVVTGGARGIGRGIVLEAARRGARVAFCARTESDAAKQTLADARALQPDGEVRFITADVGSESDVDALFDDVVDTWDQVDAVINNAGIQRDNLLVRTSLADFEAVLSTNLTGPFLVSRRAVMEFIAQGDGGRIVSIGSVSQQGAPSQAVYAATKGGLVGLTRTLAKEYGARGITANLVVCGYVQTDMTAEVDSKRTDVLVARTPLRRAGTPEEIARAALWLASPASAWVNGAQLHASGGLTCLE